MRILNKKYLLLDFFKKKECHNCGKKSRNMINYAGYNICSENCMIEYIKNITTEELLELDKRDRKVNKDYYTWIYK